MSEPLQRAMERVQDSMDDILSNFKEGVKITVLVRTPDRPAADFCMTSDDLDEVIAMVHRRKGDTPSPQTKPIGLMDVDGLRTLVGEVRARPAASRSPQGHVEPVAYRHRLTGSTEWNVSNADDMDGVRECMRHLGDRLEVEPLFAAPASQDHVQDLRDVLAEAREYIKLFARKGYSVVVSNIDKVLADTLAPQPHPIGYISRDTFAELLHDNSGDYKIVAPEDLIMVEGSVADYVPIFSLPGAYPSDPPSQMHVTGPEGRQGDWMQTVTGRQFWPIDPHTISTEVAWKDGFIVGQANPGMNTHWLWMQRRDALKNPSTRSNLRGTLTPQMIRDTAGWEQIEEELRVTLRQAANALEATEAERDALRVALRSAADQLALVHDDAFKQAAGYGLVTSDGREFSCYQLNICQTAAGKARAALATTEDSDNG